MTRVAILNSRQSKTPVGNDRWVRSTLDAVEHAAQQGWTIVSSFGLNTWELVTWAAGRRGVPLVLLCPDDFSDDERADILRRFGLRGDLMGWLTVPRDDGRSVAKNWWESRDAEIIAVADRLMPVSVRKGGRIEALITARSPDMIDHRFKIPYVSTAHHLKLDLSPDTVNPGLHNWSDDWLIHWTRACNGPWPGETEAEFYASVAASGDEYCHTGMRTLGRILSERRIRASSWRIGAGVPVVGFTELSPIESLALMRWRPRWSRWAIEPYGIAIHKSAAKALDLTAVRYVDEADWKTLSIGEKPFCHTKGKKADIWPAEREWRVAGDVQLDCLPHDHIRIIVKSEPERDAMSKSSRSQVYCFELAQ